MKIFRKLWNVVTSILIAVVVIIAILLAGVKLFGYIPYTVLSGSMEPEIKTGSIVYVKEADPDDIKVGDILEAFIMEQIQPD